MKYVITYIIGLIFGLGIVISGMGNPAKVINFFDIAGTWDPSLIFVMGGALAVTLVGYRLAFRQDHPQFDAGFHLPTRRDIDRPLVLGAATFGVGWGIAGFCPGGAFPVVLIGGTPVLLFMISLIAGLYTATLWQRRGLQAQEHLA